MTPPRDVPPPSTAITTREEPPAGGLTAFGTRGALPAAPAADHRLDPAAAGRAREAVAGAWSARTREVYGSHWAAFAAWCAAEGRQPLPAAPATVVAYLTARAPGWSLASLEQAHAAIAWAHTGHGIDPAPTAASAVKLVMKGLRATKGKRARHAKRPVTQDLLVALLTKVDRTTTRGLRDAAILLVGFHGALRRSELAGIDRAHLSDTRDGVALLIPKSKTDQGGEGHVVGLPVRNDEPDLCPVRALAAWVRAAGITEGPIFRAVTPGGALAGDRAISSRTVARVVKAYAGAAGLPEEPFAGHSLRAGLVTEAYRQGVPEAQIMETTRHKNATMLARYRREADPVRRGAAGALKSTKKET